MSVMELNLSKLLNKPKATLASLRGARRILLRRRDDEDLVLTTVARAEQDSTVRARPAACRGDDAHPRGPHPGDGRPAGDPWVRYLPAHHVREFPVELVDALGAAADLDNTAAVAQLITEWRHTAEVHADPRLHAALTTDSGEDYGPYPSPEPRHEPQARKSRRTPTRGGRPRGWWPRARGPTTGHPSGHRWPMRSSGRRSTSSDSVEEA